MPANYEGSKEQASLLTKLQPSEEDVRKMLSASVHTGTRNLVSAMKDYVYARQSDGVYVINLERTWQKLILAARVICAVENPKDVVVLSGREQGQRSVIKFATYTDCRALPGRFTPGSFTNQLQKQFVEPRLLIITDPLEDSQALREAAYVNIPVIAFCSTDCPLDYVDICIPANNKGKLSLGLLYWMLAREVQRIRGYCVREEEWEEPVDLFFHKSQEELEAIRQKQEGGGEAEEEEAAAEDVAYAGVQDEWQTAVEDWTPEDYPAAAEVGGVAEEAGVYDPAAPAEPAEWDTSAPAAAAPVADAWSAEPVVYQAPVATNEYEYAAAAPTGAGAPESHETVPW